MLKEIGIVLEKAALVIQKIATKNDAIEKKDNNPQNEEAKEHIKTIKDIANKLNFEIYSKIFYFSTTLFGVYLYIY